MSTHRHDQVNPLVNPVFQDDRILAESGQVFFVKQNMLGNFWLEYSDGKPLTHPVSGQIGICRQINDLAFL